MKAIDDRTVTPCAGPGNGTDVHQVASYFRQRRKADLHRHLLGSVTAGELWRICSENSVQQPRLSLAELRSYFQISAPVDGLRTLFRPWPLLCRAMSASPDVVTAYVISALQRAARDNVIYCELRTSWGMTGEEPYGIATFLDAARRGIAYAERVYGVTARLVMGIARHVFSRHSPRRRAQLWTEILSAAIEERRTVTGFDVTGFEDHYPAELFAVELREAKNAGFRITVHCGETTQPDAIWRTIEFIEPDRLGHALASVRDGRLLRFLADTRTPVEVCPTVNWLTGACATLAEHPISRMYKAGVKLTVGTDNPAICRTTLSRELAILSAVVGLPISAVEELATNAFAVAFSEVGMKRPPSSSVGKAYVQYSTALG